MEVGVLIEVVLPLSLFIIMLGVGLSLEVADFKRVVVFPKAVALGLFNQLCALPLIAFGLAVLFSLPPLMAVGLMLLACCPGGVTSNVVTFVARGDSALSITMTAISGLVVVATIPLILIVSTNHFMGETQQVVVPFWQTTGQIMGITVVPVFIGMVIRRLRPAFSRRMVRPARTGSTVLFVIVVALAIAANADVFREHFLALSGVTASLNLVMMIIGYASARALRLRAPQAISISIESGIQNATLAVVIATSILNQGEMAIPAVLYGPMMFITSGAVMFYFGVLEDPGPCDAPVAGAGDGGA